MSWSWADAIRRPLRRALLAIPAFWSPCSYRPLLPDRLNGLTIQSMRRRIRSAAMPLRRHSMLQLAVDGALVALAYYLAFQLRFDNGPKGYYALLRERTIWWVLLGSLP